MKLHLGCGKKHLNGYINCDISKDVNPDKIVDLEKPLPFKDNSVDEIIIYHTLEHIHNFIPLMEEMHRICKNNALIKIEVPYFRSYWAYSDPTHCRFFGVHTFEYFSTENGLNYYSKARFSIESIKLISEIHRHKRIIKNFFINLNLRFYEKFFSQLFPAEKLNIVLKTVK